jgi:hypothetical protein
MAASLPPPAQGGYWGVRPGTPTALQLCMVAGAATAIAGAAAPARQVLAWKVMPRYVKLLPASNGWPASAASCAVEHCRRRRCSRYLSD